MKNIQTYGKPNFFNTGRLGRINSFIRRKSTKIHNYYVKTLSTKKLVLVLTINGILASPLIPGGVFACPIVTNLMIR